MIKLLSPAAILVAIAQPALADENGGASGPYLGVQVSAARVQSAHSDLQGWYYGAADFGREQTAVIGGVHAGYDINSGPIVAGIVGEVNFGAVDSYGEISPVFINYAIGSRSTMLGSVRAKLGLRSGKLTGAVTGGYAISNSRQRFNETDGSGQYFSDNGSRGGWVGGLGFDYSVSEHSSIGLSASHYQFGKVEHILLEPNGAPSNCSWSAVPSPGNQCRFTLRDSFDMIAVSYSYRF